MLLLVKCYDKKMVNSLVDLAITLLVMFGGGKPTKKVLKLKVYDNMCTINILNGINISET